ncbi:AarF/ABC1/UbiB kinase family protein [Paenarthrobacter sp. DKR-5]|uniref:ABC1 kinase family protein n=1 Tax=Paenarthrobacter sp. DKR-5 TaxID=2835535 RepID=UPI001BDD10F2|nr:AarF/ABC1/UbiB kinase family protein [Paenarthrobacter sp. DKR-5]MBT1001594.1 AarF/ABC1/UbiB kinase family protein [Paenarthrobacter sp. DKR-5]
MSTHLDRYRQVAEVLARHGLGALVGISGLDRWAPLGALAGNPAERRTAPDHLRLALEELGPTFIKLGQLLSTRADLLAPEYQAELSKLQDSAPAVDGDTVRELIRQELGAAPEEVFKSFDPRPLASASIGQAHAAVLPDGTEVVVKVRRPGVVERVNEDLEILRNLAAQASRRWEAAAGYNVAGITQEFSETLRAELDYLQEGRNADRFAENFAADDGVHIPRVVWACTTSRVLTLERIRGVKVSDLDGLERTRVDRRALAVRAAGAAAKMVFEDGFFHADPHPGNLFIEPGGRIGLIDFGMVGEVDEKLRDKLGVLLVALARGNPDRIGTALVDISVTKRPADRAQLRADLVPFMALYQGRQLGQIDFAALVTRMLALLRDHHLQLPRQMAMLLKMVVMVEGMGVQLDPEFSLAEVFEPYARRLVLERFYPKVFAKRLGQAGMDAADLGVELPERLRRLFDLVDAGGVEVHLRAAELEPLIGRVEKIGNRLVAGMIVSAFIRGVGELTVGDKDKWRDWEVPLMRAGLGAAGVLSGYLAYTARRGKRPGRFS